MGTDDGDGSVKLLWMSVKINAILVVPAILIGCLASPYIMMSYGKGFRSEWPILCVVLLTAGVLSVEFPIGQMLSACGRMWLGFSSNLGWAVIFLCTNAALLRWGAFGLASARLVAFSLHAIFLFTYVSVFVSKKLKVRDVERLEQVEEANLISALSATSE
jgi:O-antigen/teichoic acid export membrane protein